MTMPPGEPTTAERPCPEAWFKTTHWSVVLGATRGDAPHAAAALSALCQTYWYPLYTFIRRSGHAPEDAKDLTQEFFARLLEKDYLKSVTRGTAKFRSFLLVALKRFMANEWDRARRLKRGGGRETISLDETATETRYREEPADETTPEKLYERRWALTLLDLVMARLEAEAEAAGKSPVFAELKVFLSGDNDRTSYARIAGKTGLSEGALRIAVHRLRQRYRDLLREEISHTVGRPEDVEDEIRHLFATLA